MIVREGRVRRRSTQRLSPEDVAAGYALACQTVIESDLELPVLAGHDHVAFVQDLVYVRSAYNGAYRGDHRYDRRHGKRKPRYYDDDDYVSVELRLPHFQGRIEWDD